ncbi:MAG: GNAT family N-acetyltransferase [Parvularculaceae bacterium]|nr:GNAT family N-acetyltransferase [Parvularculaceae bacterium]
MSSRAITRPRRSAAKVRIRPARPADLDAIDAIETASFAGDRFPRRNLARLLRRPTARALVAILGAEPVGYVLLLFRNGATCARLYSLATAPAARGRGVR